MGGRRAGYLFVSFYVVLLALFGVAPTGYALFLAFTTPGGHYDGLSNFFATARDFRFVPAFEHIAAYLAIWLVVFVVLVLALALMLHGGVRRVAPAFRFLFYLPGALVGSASVLVWLFMLDPNVSPFHFALAVFHLTSLPLTVKPGHLPVVFTVIAFWTGAGGWIVVMNGALNNISDEVLDSAKVDGANAWQLALRVKLPLIKRWVVYMFILAFAAGTQLFVEPLFVGEASGGMVSTSWSPNQLAYYMATQDGNFNYSAAISVDLLVLGLMFAALLVFRSKLFEIHEIEPTRVAGQERDLVARAAARQPAGPRQPIEPRHLGSASVSEKAKAPRRSRRALGLLVWFAVMLGFAAYFAVPLVWLLLAPTKTEAQLVSWNPLAIGSWHNVVATWDFVFNFQHHEILTWLENSGIYTGGGVVLALVSALPAGYGLALTQFIGRRVLLSITLIVMIMPASALVIPLFLEMNTLHLTDTAFSVLLPLGLFPFGVYLSYIFFSSAIPSELLNAARVDGAGEWGVFRRVALPLARPLVALIAFFAFVADWTNFFLPFMMFMDYSKDPISVGLQDLYDSGLPHPAMALSVLLAIAPVLIIFLVAQKTLATGMLAGATKE